MELLLIRHTAVNLPKGICYGVSDVQLADSWEKESEFITKRLLNQTIQGVYSSPLSRCKLLAEKISNHVVFDDRLKELNFGAWELKPWDDIKGNLAEKWMNDFVNVRCPEGESYIDLSIRIKDFLKDLTRTNNSKAAIVSHAGPIRAILAILQNIPFAKSFEIKVAHGQIIHITL